MTKKELAQLISTHSGVGVTETELVLSSLGDVLPGVLAEGESVFLRGFGTFKTVVRKARPVRNITAGTQIWMEGKVKPVLKFGADFEGRMK